MNNVYNFKEECMKRDINKYAEIEWRESNKRMYKADQKQKQYIMGIKKKSDRINKTYWIATIMIVLICSTVLVLIPLL